MHTDWRVIEIGGGANPCQRSDVITNYNHKENQQDKRLKVLKSAKMYVMDVQDMSKFKDKEFDYSICVQVLEHVDDPIKACKEIMRISKHGYIETPSQLCEQLIGWPFHKWLVMVSHKNPKKLVFIKKSKQDYKRMDDFFWRMFYKQNPNRVAFQNIINSNSDQWIVKFHWIGDFEVEVIQ